MSKKNLTFLLLFASTMLTAQTDTSSFFDAFFKHINYSKPFVSEVHSPMNKAEIGYHRDHSAYKLSERFSFYQLPVVDLHLGFDAPLVSFDLGKITNNKPQWEMGISIPVSVHILEDMWEPITAAVIDVDYRFDTPTIKGVRHLNSNGWLKNISFSIITLMHECTHLGDEFALMIKQSGNPLTRVNVSYEFTQVQLTLNDALNQDTNNHSFRITGRYRVSNRGFGMKKT